MNSPILRGSSKVTKRGQITIPQELRDKLEINPGDTIYFIEENDSINIKKGPLQIP